MENSIIFFIFLKPSLRKTIIIFLNYDIINVSYHFWYRDFEILPEVIRKNFGSIFYYTNFITKTLLLVRGNQSQLAVFETWTCTGVWQNCGNGLSLIKMPILWLVFLHFSCLEGQEPLISCMIRILITRGIAVKYVRVKREGNVNGYNAFKISINFRRHCPLGSTMYSVCYSLDNLTLDLWW